MDAADWRAILFGVVVGLATSVVLVSYWLAIGALDPATFRRALSPRSPSTDVVTIYLLGGLASAGVPTALYLRFGVISPLVLFGGIVAFWSLLPGDGDSPATLFVLALWPAYLVAYLVVASVEYWLRERGLRT